MDELDWWTSPIDHHGHPDGPRPDECAVCALEVDRDRLRDDVTALRMLLTETTTEHDQLRAVLADESEARRSFMGAATNFAEVIENLTAQRDQLQARIDAYEGHLEAWEEMAGLIAQSSLGTPEAEAIRGRTPPGVGRAIVRAAEYLARAEEAEAERDRLRAVVGHAIDTLTESAPSAPGVLATVALMRLALDPAEEGT